jgi:hypothetical protein
MWDAFRPCKLMGCDIESDWINNPKIAGWCRSGKDRCTLKDSEKEFIPS